MSIICIIIEILGNNLLPIHLYGPSATVPLFGSDGFEFITNDSFFFSVLSKTVG